MTPYIVFYAFIYALHFMSATLKSRWIFGFALLVITIFVSARYMVGWDYVHYYNAVANNVENNITQRGELFTYYLVEISRYFESPFLYFFSNAAILFLALGFFLKRYSIDPWLSLFLFIGFPLFFLNSLSVVRVFTAIALVLVAFHFLLNKKLVVYFFIVAVASLFHKSALLCLVFPIFLVIKVPSVIWLLLLLLAPLLELFATHVLHYILSIYMPAYLLYLKPTNIQEGTKAIYVLVAVSIGIALYKRKVVGDNEKIEILFNIYMLGVFLYLVLIKYGTPGHRLTLYSTVLMIIFLPLLVHNIKSFVLRLSGLIALHVVFLVFFFVTLLGGSEAYIPYQTIFSQAPNESFYLPD